MACTAKDIVNMALSQVGVKEDPPNSNNVKYNTAFYGHEVSGAAYPWCCAFVWWVFNQFSPCLVKKTAGCADLGNWFKQNNAWHNKTPQVGDVVFFKFSGNARWTNHVGIVIEVKNGYIKTVEGNTAISNNNNGGEVMVRERSSNIVGYGRPAYASDSDLDSEYQYGVDVSELQGVIDFDKLKADNIQFMCMRSTKKSSNPDAQFTRNLHECISHRIDYSCYKYAYALDSQGAINEAKGVCDLLKANNVKMTIWYDLEDDILVPLGKDGIEALTNIFALECQKHGFEVGIYCNQNWYANYISDGLKKKYMFWIARYGKNTGYIDEQYKPTGPNVVAWQYTSKGRVNGISGNVDRDVWYL